MKNIVYIKTYVGAYNDGVFCMFIYMYSICIRFINQEAILIKFVYLIGMINGPKVE